MLVPREILIRHASQSVLFSEVLGETSPFGAIEYSHHLLKVAPRERFELPRVRPTRFPVERDTRLCDLGNAPSTYTSCLTITPNYSLFPNHRRERTQR